MKPTSNARTFSPQAPSRLGAAYFVSRLSQEERLRGVITAPRSVNSLRSLPFRCESYRRSARGVEPKVEAIKNLEAILVPIGGGSGAAAACIVAKSINPQVKIIGVQAEKAPSVYLSWKNKRFIETKSAETFADASLQGFPSNLRFASSTS